MSDSLLSEEVTDLHSIAVTLDDTVDGEVSVDGTHLVEEALRDASNHVLDQGFDCSQAGDMLPSTLPDSKKNLVGRALGEPDIHINVSDILRECSSRTSDRNDAGLDGDLDALRNVKFFCL